MSELSPESVEQIKKIMSMSPSESIIGTDEFPSKLVEEAAERLGVQPSSLFDELTAFCAFIESETWTRAVFMLTEAATKPDNPQKGKVAPRDLGESFLKKSVDARKRGGEAAQLTAFVHLLAQAGRQALGDKDSSTG